MPRTNFETSATLQRLGSYSGVASYAAVGSAILGYFSPIEPSQKTIALGIVGQGYEFICDGGEDVKVNDIMTINSVDYGVKGVARYQSFSQDILKVTLELNSKD